MQRNTTWYVAPDFQGIANLFRYYPQNTGAGRSSFVSVQLTKLSETGSLTVQDEQAISDVATTMFSGLSSLLELLRQSALTSLYSWSGDSMFLRFHERGLP
jgi:hypothetical protein